MKYKTLIVSGCSFTENQGSWAYQLASKYDLNLINLAYPGAGNQHIVWSLISFLEKNIIDIDTTLIGIMWSHPIRIDHVVERNKAYNNQEIFKYAYDDHNYSVIHRDILKHHKLHRLREVILSYMWTNHNRSAIAFTTWTLKTSLNAYLENNKFKFFQTSFHNYFTRSEFISNLPGTEFIRDFEYIKELEKNQLKHNHTNWLDIPYDQYLGDYAFNNNLLNTQDKHHPSIEGHKQWTENILIPAINHLL